MPKVITQQSTLKCAHGGTLTLSASQSKLKLGGAAVLVAGDLDGKSISLCPTPTTPPPPGPVNKPCTTVAGVIAGTSVRLKVGGKAVLLETVAGTTDGVLANVPAQPWSVTSANQSKLSTV